MKTKYCVRGETAHETKQKGRGRADRVGTAIRGRGKGSGKCGPPGENVVLGVGVMRVWVTVV